jgi:phosphoribosylformylglycinamidine synthase
MCGIVRGPEGQFAQQGQEEMVVAETLTAQVYITPKRGILDPQGMAIQRSLHSLGFGEVTDVRLGKYLEIRLAPGSLEAVRGRVDEMCRRLLANGVIEDYRFEVAAGARQERF